MTHPKLGASLSPPPRRVAARQELRCFDRRQELEAALEAEAAAAGRPWLGQLVGATWEISPKAASAALTAVLEELVSIGLVRCPPIVEQLPRARDAPLRPTPPRRRVPPTDSGKPVPLYAVANTYFKGEAFNAPEKRAKAAMTDEERKAAKQKQREEEWEEAYDELAELEKQRLRNIERNKELLRQLGLA